MGMRKTWRGVPRVDQAGPASDYTCNFKRFTREEQNDVRGAMAKEVQADLRAVHYELQYDQNWKKDWETTQQRMMRTGSDHKLVSRAILSKDQTVDYREKDNVDLGHGLMKERSGY